MIGSSVKNLKKLLVIKNIFKSIIIYTAFLRYVCKPISGQDKLYSIHRNSCEPNYVAKLFVFFCKNFAATSEQDKALKVMSALRPPFRPTHTP